MAGEAKILLAEEFCVLPHRALFVRGAQEQGCAFGPHSPAAPSPGPGRRALSGLLHDLSSKHQAALGLRDRASEFLCRFDPFLHDDFHIG